MLFPLMLIVLLVAKLEGMILGYTEDIMIWNELVFSVALLFSALCLVASLRYVIVMNDIQITKNLNEQQLEMLYGYYQKRLEYENQAKKIYHDLNKHLSILESMKDGKEKDAYMERIQQTLKEVQYPAYTGNEIIDLVIQDKKEQFKEIEISAVCTGNIDSIKKIENFDLVTVFGNALDNGAEALRKDRSAKQEIDIRIKLLSHFVMIEFSNEYTGESVEYAMSSKEDKRMHGYGISNIMDVVKKYDGQAEIRTEEGKFILQLLFLV
ncbi:MAG: GHKL domain-containing protein [Clostridiales bacterium]|nr:GHKL domain-containing protein [Clostridiales bacterium]